MARAKQASTPTKNPNPTQDVQTTKESDEIVKSSRLRKPPAPVTITLPTVQPKDERAVQQQAADVCIAAATIAKHITSAADEQSVTDYRNEVIKPGLSEVDRIFKPILNGMKEVYDTTRTQYNELRRPFEQADRLLLDAATQWRVRLKHEHEEAQRKAEEEVRLANIQAAKDRHQRYIDLQAQVEKDLEELSEAEGLSEDEIDRLVQEIEAPLREFEEYLAAPKPTLQQLQQSAVVVVAAPEVSGSMSLQDRWRGTVTNKLQILQQILDGVLPESLVEIKEPEANKLAQLYQDKKRFPGIEFRNDPFVRGSGRR